MKNKTSKNIRTMPISIAVPSLNEWLKYHCQVNHIIEVVVEIDSTDTVMTIALKREDFPGDSK